MPRITYRGAEFLCLAEDPASMRPGRNAPDNRFARWETAETVTPLQ